jgi:hypothetical protein
MFRATAAEDPTMTDAARQSGGDRVKQCFHADAIGAACSILTEPATTSQETGHELDRT